MADKKSILHSVPPSGAILTFLKDFFEILEGFAWREINKLEEKEFWWPATGAPVVYGVFYELFNVWGSFVGYN